jgi:hypothetical protein
MQKHISGARNAPVNVVLITLDNHMSAAVDDARQMLLADIPNLRLTVHAATDWDDNPDRLQACKDDIAQGNIIVASMLFIEEHVKAIGPSLAARRDQCDAMMCCMSAGEIMKNTSMGRFKMDGEQKGPLAILKKLRGDRSKSRKDTGRSAGERQIAMLRRLPKLLRFIPGTAQDLRNYFLAMQYRIAASDVNIANLVRLLVDKYCRRRAARLSRLGHGRSPRRISGTGRLSPRHQGPGQRHDIKALPAKPAPRARSGFCCCAPTSCRATPAIMTASSARSNAAASMSCRCSARASTCAGRSRPSCRAARPARPDRRYAVADRLSRWSADRPTPTPRPPPTITGRHSTCLMSQRTSPSSSRSSAGKPPTSGLLPIETTIMVAIPGTRRRHRHHGVRRSHGKSRPAIKPCVCARAILAPVLKGVPA